MFWVREMKKKLNFTWRNFYVFCLLTSLIFWENFRSIFSCLSHSIPRELWINSKNKVSNFSRNQSLISFHLTAFKIAFIWIFCYFYLQQSNNHQKENKLSLQRERVEEKLKDEMVLDIKNGEETKLLHEILISLNSHHVFSSFFSS